MVGAEGAGGPVNLLSVFADPWHPKDAVIQVLKFGDDHVGLLGFVVEKKVDFIGRWLLSD